MKLSIVIPVYNEKGWLLSFWQKFSEAPISKCPGITSAELVVVDDGSTDGTREILSRLCAENFHFKDGTVASITFLANPLNQGKGYSVSRGIGATTGEVVLIQDADLEYYVTDYPALIRPITDGTADAVFGSRLAGSSRQVLHFIHALVNRLITLVSNVLTNLDLSDMEACYKVFRGGIVRNLRLTSKRFGIEPELAARLARADVRIYEVPIRYSARRTSQGKKLRPIRDGVSAFFHILKFALWDREPYKPGLMRTLHQLEISKEDEFGLLIQKLMSHLEIVNHSVRLLLVNGGISCLCKQLMTYGKLVVADPSEEVVKALKDRYHPDESLDIVQIGDPSQQWNIGGKFDIILAYESNSSALLKKLRNYLDEKGCLILLEQAASTSESHSKLGFIEHQKLELSLESASNKKQGLGFRLLRPIPAPNL